ncbi:hypothetical protein COTS27_00406 [Spirochaetota bacterium]|nr:hypothetical protein COTS27_00406 [Spirochaetota bacterium]
MNNKIEDLFKISPKYRSRQKRQGTMMDNDGRRMSPLARVVYEKAVIAYKKKHYEQAGNLFKMLLDKKIPSSVCAYFGAICFMKLGQLSTARTYFEKTIALKKNYYHAMYAHIFLGYLAIKDNNLPEALEWLELPVKNDFESPLPYSFMGYIMEKQKNYTLAQKYYKQSLARDPENPSFKNNLAFTYLAANENLDEAETLIKQAVKKDSHNPAYLHSWGWFFFIKRKFKEALKALSYAASFTKDYVIVRDLNIVKQKLKDS